MATNWNRYNVYLCAAWYAVVWACSEKDAIRQAKPAHVGAEGFSAVPVRL